MSIDNINVILSCDLVMKQEKKLANFHWQMSKKIA